MQCDWQVAEYESEKAAALVSALNLSPVVASLLVQRGITDPQAALEFLNPSLDRLHDPFLMKNMATVVERLERAVASGERVLIYGDYDVDGISAIVVLKRALEMMGGQVDFYLPKRLEEGYGLKAEVIRQARELGYGLVISVDSGIRAFDACLAAREVGIDLIVTDHHLPDTCLPPAFSILNPRQPDCPYPDKDLAAVGVVFKIVQALFRRAGKERIVEHFLKLVAIGTVADMVPVTGENRVIVRNGLLGLAEPHNVGLKALLSGAGIGREVSLVDVGFRLAPRINAVTRMGGGREVVNLFSAKTDLEAQTIVDLMNTMNAERQNEERRVLASIDKLLGERPELLDRYFMVVKGDGWHRGVIGIVASRLVERFYRPVFVLSSDGEVCQGSGRSIPGFHLVKALDSCQDLLIQYGGHLQAAGCSIQASRWEQVADRLDAYARSVLTARDLVPVLRIDRVLPIASVSLKLAEDLEQLAPFGLGNPLPVFASNKVDVAAGPWILKEKHLKLRLGSNGSQVDAIWWKNGAVADTIRSRPQLDLAYTISRETYQGRQSVLLGIRDLRPV